MRNFYEWLKIVWGEKINIFIKGFFGGGFVSSVFLFGNPVHDAHFVVLVFSFFLKLLAVGLSGLVSGCATVWGTDFAKGVTKKFNKWRKKKGNIK